MNFELYFSKILFSLYTEIKYEISLFYLKIFFTFCLFCPLLFFSQLHLIPCASPPFILQRRIMLLRRIDITVSQNICDEVNIAGFTVQIRAVGAAEFMWRDLFKRCDELCVFFDHFFHAAYVNALTLHGEEECFFAAFLWDNMFTLAEIVLKRIFYLGTKIYDDFLSAFSMNPKTTVSEINIVDIQSDTF